MLLKGAYCVGEHFVDPHSTDYFKIVLNFCPKDRLWLSK